MDSHGAGRPARVRAASWGSGGFPGGPGKDTGLAGPLTCFLQRLEAPRHLGDAGVKAAAPVDTLLGADLGVATVHPVLGRHGTQVLRCPKQSPVSGRSPRRPGVLAAAFIWQVCNRPQPLGSKHVTPPTPQHRLEEHPPPTHTSVCSLGTLASARAPPSLMCPWSLVGKSMGLGSLQLAGTRGNLGAPEPRNKFSFTVLSTQTVPLKKMNSVRGDVRSVQKTTAHAIFHFFPVSPCPPGTWLVTSSWDILLSSILVVEASP